MESNQTAPDQSPSINLRDFENLNYWAVEFGVTRERIIRAVHTVGPLVCDVRREVAETY